MNTQQRNQHDLIAQRALCPTDRKLHIHQAAHQPTSQSHRTSKCFKHQQVFTFQEPRCLKESNSIISKHERVSKRKRVSKRPSVSEPKGLQACHSVPTPSKAPKTNSHMICILASSTMPCRNIRCAHFQGLWGYVSFTGICWKCGAWWSAQLHGLALSFMATWFWVSRV